MLDNFDDLDIPEEDEVADSGGNRSFIMVAGGIGALIVVALLMMAAYIFFFRPDPNAAQQAADETQAAQQATTDALNQSLTETADALAILPTMTNTPVPAIEEVAPAEDVVEEPTQDPRTATVQALLTQASMAQTQAVVSTLTPTPEGALPDTGFMDDFGAPGLAALGLVLILIIFMERGLRQANI